MIETNLPLVQRRKVAAELGMPRATRASQDKITAWALTAGLTYPQRVTLGVSDTAYRDAVPAAIPVPVYDPLPPEAAKGKGAKHNRATLPRVHRRHYFLPIRQRDGGIREVTRNISRRRRVRGLMVPLVTR